VAKKPAKRAVTQEEVDRAYAAAGRQWGYMLDALETRRRFHEINLDPIAMEAQLLSALLYMRQAVHFTLRAKALDEQLNTKS